MILDDHLDPGPAPCALLIEATPDDLLRQPLEFLFAEHFRHRQLCRILDHLAESTSLDVALMARADDFIRYDLALHVIDEEEDLFPLLRRRCPPEDDIDRVLSRLSADHQEDAEQARLVRRYLSEAMGERLAPMRLPGASPALMRFAGTQRSHIALENAIIMPIARARLTPLDLQNLARRLSARRGVFVEP
jgi:hemerythrin-like domain-containing protein